VISHASSLESIMPVIVLTDPQSGSTAKILPELGFNCFEFTARVRDWTISVLEADPEFVNGQLRPSGHGIPILFPFPNRIRDSRFTWNGRTHEIPADVGLHDKLGHAIHGFCLDKPWRVIARHGHSAVGQFQLSVDAPERRDLWPADFRIEVRYELRAGRLRCDIRIENPDTTPLPWGFGTHPYFRVPLEAGSHMGHCLVQVPARQQWSLVDCLPTGDRREVSPEKDLRDGEYLDVLTLDDVLTDLEPTDGFLETTIYDEAAGLQMTQRFGTEFREVVVFTPPNRPCVCVEPYTCTTDAINLAARGIDGGLQVLLPGQAAHLWFEVAAGTLLC
jgi:aldose 1-epimerase